MKHRNNQRNHCYLRAQQCPTAPASHCANLAGVSGTGCNPVTQLPTGPQGGSWHPSVKVQGQLLWSPCAPLPVCCLRHRETWNSHMEGYESWGSSWWHVVGLPIPACRKGTVGLRLECELALPESSVALGCPYHPVTSWLTQPLRVLSPGHFSVFLITLVLENPWEAKNQRLFNFFLMCY